LSDVMLFDVILSDVMLSNVMLSDVMLSDVMLSDVMLSDVMLSDDLLRDVILSDVVMLIDNTASGKCCPSVLYAFLLDSTQEQIIRNHLGFPIILYCITRQ
jgi:hypothetical protein